MEDTEKEVIYYPILLNIQNKKCVVVGGGKVALRRIQVLLECGAEVTLVSPAFDPELTKLVEDKKVKPIYHEFEIEDLRGAVIAIAATDAGEINLRVAEEARKRGIFVNVADNPKLSDFIIPSSFRRGDLMIAVSTSGMSPALSKKMRTRLEQAFGEEYALLLSMIKEIRKELKMQGVRVNTGVWQEALDLDLLISLIKAGETEKARAALLEKLNSPREGT